MKQVSIGLFGIGLNTYWGQFKGLKEKLCGYQAFIAEGMAKEQVRVVDAGMVDDVEKAHEASGLLRREGVELVFLYIATYALSSTVLPVVQKLNCPVIVLNLQPDRVIDLAKLNSLGDKGKMTGMWLEHCQACSVPEVCAVFNRAGIKYDIITGYLKEEEAWGEIRGFLAAARVKYGMGNTRLGILGHYYNGMLDVYTDVTKQQITFHTDFQLLEMCELKKYRDEATPLALERKKDQFHAFFEVSADCPEEELVRAARTAVALDSLVEAHSLGGLSYYYEGIDGNEYEDLSTSVIAGNTILTAGGIPVAGECEVKNLLAMKILSLMGIGGSFAEFYALDLQEGDVLLGHDGPAHASIAEGAVRLVPLPVYHGKPGKGLSIQMSVKHGPVTILSVVEAAEGVRLLVAEGESVAGEVLEIGNTNSRYKFPIGVKRFMNEWSKAGPSHHCAIGLGHHAGTIEKLAFLLTIPVTRIC